MKKSSFILLASLLAFPAAILAAPFEGTVNINISTPGKTPTEMEFQAKKNRARVSIRSAKKDKSNEVTQLVDYEKPEMITLIPDKKTYMAMPMKGAFEAVGNAFSTKDTVVEKTGETQKILGYTCEKYLAKSPKNTSEMWFTDDLGAFPGLNAPASKAIAGESWEKAFGSRDVFPMRMIAYDKKGKEESRWEVISVKKESVPDSAVNPPADYQRMDMPDIGGMMKGMMKGLGR